MQSVMICTLAKANELIHVPDDNADEKMLTKQQMTITNLQQR